MGADQANGDRGRVPIAELWRLLPRWERVVYVLAAVLFLLSFLVTELAEHLPSGWSAGIRSTLNLRAPPAGNPPLDGQLPLPHGGLRARDAAVVAPGLGGVPAALERALSSRRGECPVRLRGLGHHPRTAHPTGSNRSPPTSIPHGADACRCGPRPRRRGTRAS